MKIKVFILILLSWFIVGCGGNVVHKQLPVKVVSGHQCNPKNQVMQCVLPPPPVGLHLGSSPISIQGGDFGWSGISGPSCRANGWKFGASYLSFDTSKNWTLSLVNSYHANGCATVAVFEAGGSDATLGFNLGFREAKAAMAQLIVLHAPPKQPFTLAIDCDCSGLSVAQFFRGADAAAGVARVNAYGGYFPLQYLCAHHLVGHFNWQTYAWSHGLWLPASCAPLEQYLNGSAFDHDRAIALNYGQWPYVAPKPPGPSPIDIALAKARDKALTNYHKAHCKAPIFDTANCYIYAKIVIDDQVQLPKPWPECWGKHAQLSAPICQIVRPAVSIWTHAGFATYNAYLRHGCQGPAAPVSINRRDCNRLRRLDNHFHNKVATTFKEF